MNHNQSNIVNHLVTMMQNAIQEKTWLLNKDTSGIDKLLQ